MVLGSSPPSSLNLIFWRNLTDSKIEHFQGLLLSLGSVHLSPSIADSRGWSLSSKGLFTVKSFLLALSLSPTPPLFHLAKFLWSSKAPSKVKAFSWLVAHKKVNTNDLLQLRRPYRSLNPSGVFFVKAKERPLITFFFIVPSLVDCGTSFST